MCSIFKRQYHRQQRCVRSCIGLTMIYIFNCLLTEVPIQGSSENNIVLTIDTSLAIAHFIDSSPLKYRRNMSLYFVISLLSCYGPLIVICIYTFSLTKVAGECVGSWIFSIGLATATGLQVVDAADDTAIDADTGTADPGKSSIVWRHPGELNDRQRLTNQTNKTNFCWLTWNNTIKRNTKQSAGGFDMSVSHYYSAWLFTHVTFRLLNIVVGENLQCAQPISQSSTGTQNLAGYFGAGAWVHDFS